MSVTRLLFTMTCATLLVGADDPASTSSLVLAKPVKIIKFLGFYGKEELPHDGVYLVKMKTLSVIEGPFKGRTFDTKVSAHVAGYIFQTKEYIVPIKFRDGKYEPLDAEPVLQYFCLSPDALVESGINLSYRMSEPSDRDDGYRCSPL